MAYTLAQMIVDEGPTNATEIIKHAGEVGPALRHAAEVERLCMLAAPIGRDPRGCMRLEYRAGESLPRVVVEGSE
jgi:hypothetical protein